MAIGYWSLALGGQAFSAEPPPTTPIAAQPFLNLRARPLEYLGPEAELADPSDLTEIPLGWFGPSDPDEPVSGDLWWSVDLAVREANARGGCGGRPLRLVPKWSENPWGTGIAGLFKAVYEDRLYAIIGSIDGASTHLAEQVVAKARLPLISAVSTDKSVNLAGVSWMFSCALSDDTIVPVIADLALAALPHADGRLVLFSGTDHDSRLIAGELLKALSRKKRFPDFRFEMPARAVSLESQLTAFKKTLPGAILLVAEPEDAARLAKAIREILPDCPIIGDHRLARHRFIQLAGIAAEGVRLPLLFAPSETNTAASQFVAQFKARYQRQPDYAAALSYDAACLVIEAARRAGPNRVRIREELGRLSPWQGAAGQVRWNGVGENTGMTPQPGVIRDGRTVPLPSPADATANRGSTEDPTCASGPQANSP